MAEYFDRGQILMNGAPVADLEGGSVEISNGFQDVVTINKGWAGGSKGPLMGSITGKRAVPRAGFASAQDLHNAVKNQSFVQAMCITGGKKYVVTGVYKGLRRDFGVNATAIEDFALSGAIEVTDL